MIATKFQRLYPCFRVRQHGETSGDTVRRVDKLGINRQLIRAIFDPSYIHLLSSLSIGLVLLPDPKNLGIAVGILLPTYTQAEKCVKSLLLPVDDRHL